MQLKTALMLVILVGSAALIGRSVWQSAKIDVQDRQSAARFDSVAKLSGEVTLSGAERQALVQPEQVNSLISEPPVQSQLKWTPSEMPLNVPSPFPVIVAEPGVPIDPNRWATVGGLGRTPTPDSVFEAKYPPNTESGLLLGNSMLLRQQAMKKCAEVAKAQFDVGDYEEVQFPDEKSEFGPKYDTNFYLGAQSNVLPQYSVRILSNSPTGRAKIAFCRFADHPDIYEMLDEANYLSRRLDAQRSY
jgi:hypothetical protein